MTATTTNNAPDGPNEGNLDTRKGDVKSGDFTQDLVVESGAFAIVDASLLDAAGDSPLVAKAIVIPVKADGTFTISGKYGEEILKELSIRPKQDVQGNVVPQTPEKAEGDVVVPEGSSLGHDSSLERRMRSVWSKKARDHLSGKERHKPDPTRRAVPMRKRGTREVAEPQEMKDIYAFINATAKGNNVITREDIEQVQDKVLLGKIIDKLYSMCLSGWELHEGVLKNTETGVIANEKVWQVHDGLLVDAAGKRPEVSFEWAYQAREAYKEYTKGQNVNMVEDFINHARGIQG